MIKGYYEFILESILYTSKELQEILKSIDDTIAKDFTELINKDIETPYNGLNVTDKNDTISFSPDNQFQRKITTGTSLETLLKDSSNKTSVGRLIQKILHENDKNYSPNQVTEFTDKFKAAYLKYFSKEKEVESIRVVEGDEIKEWYLEDSYFDETLKGKGTLGKSCMRYGNCQSYFKIYTENPDVCKMIINTTFDEMGEEKLVSRALVWKTLEAGWYLDRIYFTDASEKILIKEFADKNFGVKHAYDFGASTPRLSIQLSSKKQDYVLYPYMDSFPYYHTTSRKLFNYEPTVTDRQNLYEIQSTDGEPTSMDMIYSEVTGEMYSSDEVIWSEYHQSYIPVDDSVTSYYFNSEIYAPNSYYSETLEDYIPDDVTLKVYIDLKGKTDYFPEKHEDIEVDEESGDWYLKKLLVKIDNAYYLESSLLIVHTITEESKKDYCRIFNLDENIDIKECICSLVAEKSFGFETTEVETKMPLREYTMKVYDAVIFDILESRLEKLIKDEEVLKDFKSGTSKIQDEIIEAKYWLSSSLGLSRSLNYLYNVGGTNGEAKLLEGYKELLNLTGFDRAGNLLDVSIDYAMNNRLMDLIKSASDISKDEIIDIIKKIINNNLLEFCEGVDSISQDYPKFDEEKLKNIKQIIKKEIGDYEQSDAIYEVLIILISRTIKWSIYFIQVRTGFNLKSESIHFFLKHPNKLKKLEYNP